MYYFVPKQRIVRILSIVYCSLLVVDFHLYLGRTSPFIIFCFAKLGAKFRVVFSIMLLAPSWGGMINGLTLRGVWDKVRVELF
jgi:cbb3-type cytochrome oxidase subunit 1